MWQSIVFVDVVAPLNEKLADIPARTNINTYNS